MRRTLLNFFSLFTSVGTLLCCALPSLLVLIGLGATVASFLSALPWLVSLSQHKGWVFLVSGLLIGANFAYTYWLAPQLQFCPTDAPEPCQETGRLSRVILWISAGLYATGLFSAYLLGPLLMRYA